MSSNCQEVKHSLFPTDFEQISFSLCLEKISRLFDVSNESVKHYYLGSAYPGMYLTPQEARCMFYFLQGLTNQQVGRLLGLSDRTVGSYANNMQRKLRLRNKKKMIEAIKKTDFLEHFSEEVLLVSEC